MQCYACEKEPEQQCRRCGRSYCEDHGDNLCGECLNPASAVPSPTIYRGSLLALVVGTAIVIWLLVAPPALPGDSVAVDGAPRVAEADAAADGPQPANPSAPAPTPTAATPTPTAPPLECPEGTTQQAPGCVYVVAAGDTISTIAERFGIGAQALLDANGLPDESLQVGQQLVLPPT
ncbi:MAG: LysM peptidoglycan-binding domain-containing protein [Dehalococcoidia bacterium]